MRDYERKIIEEYIRRSSVPAVDLAIIKNQLFDKQLQVILDPSLHKTLVCSRRAGKTYTCIRYMLLEAFTAPCRICYITDTRDHAKRLVWEPLLEVLQTLGVSYEANISELTIRLAGSKIELFGADNERVAGRLRGFAFKLAILDEAGSFSDHLPILIKEILGPSMKERKGTILLCGTPNASCAGYFYDAAHDDWYSHFEWDVTQNPEFPLWAGMPNWQDLAKATVEQWRINEGFKLDDPEFLREYKGLWAKDSEARLLDIPESALININELPPQDKLQFTLGIDLGFIDAAAYAPIGYSQHTGKAYIFPCHTAASMDLSSLIAKTYQLIETYKPTMTVCDPAAGGKHLVEEIANRWNLPAIPAEKQEKESIIRLLRSAFRTGELYIIRNSPEHKQLNSLVWNLACTREAEGQPCDMFDAILYAFRFCYQYLHIISKPKPTEEDRLLENRIKKMSSSTGRSWV